MQSLKHSALAHLDLSERRILASTSRTWSPTTRFFLQAARRHPLLRRYLPPPLDHQTADQHSIVWNADSIPKEPERWGPLAFLTLELLCDPVLTRRDGLKIGPYQLASHAAAQSARGGAPGRSSLVESEHYLVLPAIDWLRRSVLAEFEVNERIEAWVQRTLWLYCTKPCRQEEVMEWSEEQFQLDLHRFLLDTGTPVGDATREHPAVRGRIDFLLTTGEPCLVETKVWKNHESANDLRRWYNQVHNYATSNGIRLAYLVVVNVSTRNLLTAPKSVNAGSFVFHLRMVDVARPPASKDGRTIVQLPLPTDSFDSAPG